MPFFWTGGFSQGLLAVIAAGATLITEAVAEPERTLRLLERERVTLFRGWPDQAARLAAHPNFATTDLSSLRPASLPAVLASDRRPSPGARAVLFGMTETNGPWCGDRLDVDLPTAAWGSCGRPLPGIDLRITDPESGAPCPPGTTGEIRLRGATLMRGISGRTRDDVFDADGFYPTGDLGSVDDEGYVRAHGRSDDMFKISGATVYPSEVETALRAISGVDQAHVTNVREPNGSDEVAALVVTRADLASIADSARARLSAFKVPTIWAIARDAARVPMTATAKVDKTALQTLLAAEGDRLNPGPRQP
jgi:acyl-coenzyme A synthetase/AMP-(fatty) acid ligase